MNLLDRMLIGFTVCVFAFAGIDKIVHFDGFLNALGSYRILPIALAPILAPLIISAELAMAVGLAVDRWRRLAAAQAAILVTLLTLALGLNRLLGAEGICGCWFSFNMAPGNLHFVFNLALIAISTLIWHSTRPSGDAQGPN